MVEIDPFPIRWIIRSPHERQGNLCRYIFSYIMRYLVMNSSKVLDVNSEMNPHMGPHLQCYPELN